MLIFLINSKKKQILSWIGLFDLTCGKFHQGAAVALSELLNHKIVPIAVFCCVLVPNSLYKCNPFSKA